MKQIEVIVFFLLGCVISMAQSLTGTDLLNLAIEYHDPKGQWSEFSGILDISMERPERPTRKSVVTVDLPNAYYNIYTKSVDSETTYTLAGDDCEITWNGKTEFTMEEVKKNRLTCDRAEFMRNYYIYLYGLPMKLKDSGTNVHNEVQVKIFKGRQYNVLKVTYDEAVGKDIWYFYFDQETNAMEVYQFYHDETKNDGEYVLLNGELKYGKMKIPKDRTWYTNHDEKLLGTDKLLSINKYKK